MGDVYVKPRTKSENASLLTSINTYVDLDEFKIKGLHSKCIVMQATTNDLLFSIDFSPDDGVTWINRLTDILVAAAATVVREDDTNAELRGMWTDCRIQIKPNVAATHGTGEHFSNFSVL